MTHVLLAVTSLSENRRRDASPLYGLLLNAFAYSVINNTIHKKEGPLGAFYKQFVSKSEVLMFDRAIMLMN